MNVKDIVAISWSDYQKYGCPRCGCASASSNSSGCGAADGRCMECDSEFVILGDGIKECPIMFGNEKYKPKLQKHPRVGKWPHEFVRPDIVPKGIEGEFWDPRGIGYDLSGFVKTKAAGERIVKMVKEIIGNEPKSWLDYRPNEPMWIQVKIQPEDGFDLKILNTACADGVITKTRLANAYKEKEK